MGGSSEEEALARDRVEGLRGRGKVPLSSVGASGSSDRYHWAGTWTKLEP